MNTYITAPTIKALREQKKLTQAQLADQLSVSHKTISKWETDESLPDIRQSKKLAVLYHMTLDELIEYDFDQQQAQEMIDSVSEEEQGMEQKVPCFGFLPRKGSPQ